MSSSNSEKKFAARKVPKMEKVKMGDAKIDHCRRQAPDRRQSLTWQSMQTLSREDKVFIISQYYVSKSASEIQRKFKRDRKTMVSLPMVSMWLQRWKTEFQSSYKLERKVSVGVIISHVTHTSCKHARRLYISLVTLLFSSRVCRRLELGLHLLEPH